MGVVTYILLSGDLTLSTGGVRTNDFKLICFAGTMPFDDDNRNKIYRAILKAKYDFPDEVSEIGLSE